MHLAASVILFLPGVLAAQSAPEDIVPKLVADLMLLKLAVAWDEPLHDAPYTFSELQSLSTYSQNEAMKPFQTTLMDFQMRQETQIKRDPREPIRIRPFIGPDEAYKLAYVLTGKDLTVANLTPLVEALFRMLQSAEVCRQKRFPATGSAELRQSAEDTWTALQTFGVPKADLRIVMNSLLQGAAAMSVRPPPLKYR